MKDFNDEERVNHHNQSENDDPVRVEISDY
jgi:hypothetical protein